MTADSSDKVDLDELLDEDEASYVNQRRPRIRTAGVTAGQLSEARRNGMQFEIDHDDPEMRALAEEIRALHNLNSLDSTKQMDQGQADAVSSLADFDTMKSRMVEIFPDGSIYKHVIVAGDGQPVELGMQVKFHYQMWILGQDQPFDSSLVRRRIKRVELGTDMMLEGVKIGMLTMRVGEIAQFLFKPHLGFGEVGGPPRVPPNAEILAEIQVISMEHTDEPVDFMNYAELSQLPYADVWKYVENKLEQGKSLFKRGKYGSACNRYRRARDLLESRVYVPDGFSKEERTVTLAKLYRNLALCYLQLDNPVAAVDNAQLAVEMDDRDAKALYLWAKAVFLTGDYHEALKLAEQAQKIASSKEIRDLILKIDAKIFEYENAAKAQAQKMLGISK